MKVEATLDSEHQASAPWARRRREILEAFPQRWASPGHIPLRNDGSSQGDADSALARIHPYSRVAEGRNTFGSEGARAFLKFFSVPPFFAKKPLRRSLRFVMFPAEFFRRGAPSKELEPQGALFLRPRRGSKSRKCIMPFLTQHAQRT